MSKTETALVLVAVGAAAWWLYKRSQVAAVAGGGDKFQDEHPNTMPKDGHDFGDYIDAGKTVVDGAKKVGGALEDAWDWITK